MMDCMYEYWYYFTCHILNVILQSAGWSLGEWPLELDRANRLTLESVFAHTTSSIQHIGKTQQCLSKIVTNILWPKKSHRTCCSVRWNLLFFQLAGREVATDATRKVKGKLCGQGILRCHPGWEGQWSAVGSNFVWDASVMFNEWIQNFRIFDMWHWSLLQDCWQ